MVGWKPFNYNTINEVRKDITELKVNLPISGDLGILSLPIELYGRMVKNRFVIQPMECFDATEKGAPSKLTFRRYKRYSAGGAGVIWFESTSTSPKNKSSRWQCRITEENLPKYQQLICAIKDSSKNGYPPFNIVQITNNGRNAVYDGGKRMIVNHNPYLPKPNTEIASDQFLDNLIQEYVQSAKLYKKAGFDAVDIKACNGFLISEMLSAFTREKSKYGGSFKNRTRFLIEVIDRINKEVGINISVRLSVCDLLPYPYGWGMSLNGSMTPDYSEPIKLCKMLVEMGVILLNITVGRNATHIQSPYNRYSHYPRDHQLTAMAFVQGAANVIKKEVPDSVVVASTFSWARHYSANIAAGGISSGMYDLAGFGRMALAYPDFVKDIFSDGKMYENKCCTACNNCWNMVGAAAPKKCPVGCPIRDREIYGVLYRKYVGLKRKTMSPSAVELFDMSEIPPSNPRKYIS